MPVVSFHRPKPMATLRYRLPHEAEAKVLLLALARKGQLSNLDLSSPRFVGADVMPVLASCAKLQSLRLHGECWRLQRLQQDESSSAPFEGDDEERYSGRIRSREAEKETFPYKLHESFPYKLHALLSSEQHCPWWATVRCLVRFEAVTAHSCSWDSPLTAWEGACRGELDSDPAYDRGESVQYSGEQHDLGVGEHNADSWVNRALVESTSDPAARTDSTDLTAHPLLPVLQVMAHTLCTILCTHCILCSLYTAGHGPSAAGVAAPAPASPQCGHTARAAKG
jgi:hypothetical protein